MSGDVWKDGLDMLLGKLETWGETAIEMLPNVLIAILVVFVFWMLSRWVFNLQKKIFERTHLNENLENLLANMAQLIVIAVGLVVALAVLNLQKTVLSLLAGVGVVGIALGFAFQDLAANFISGVMLAVRAPLDIGDLININGIQGTVREINLRDTVIRTSSGQDVCMPNKEFTSNHFINFSRSGFRRIDLKVGVAYEDSIEEAMETIRRAVSEVDGILQDPAPDIYVTELADSAVVVAFEVFYGYPGGSFNALKGKCLAAVKNALDDAGITMSYPVRSLTLQKDVVELVKKDVLGFAKDGSAPERAQREERAKELNTL